MKQGEEFRAQITTRPDADLGIIFGFSDEDTHGTMHIAQANEHGAHTVVLLITPEMPPGPAEMLVSSGKGGEGAAMEYRFEVVRARGTCK